MTVIPRGKICSPHLAYCPLPCQCRHQMAGSFQRNCCHMHPLRWCQKHHCPLKCHLPSSAPASCCLQPTDPVSTLLPFVTWACCQDRVYSVKKNSHQGCRWQVAHSPHQHFPASTRTHLENAGTKDNCRKGIESILLHLATHILRI